MMESYFFMFRRMQNKTYFVSNTFISSAKVGPDSK